MGITRHTSGADNVKSLVNLAMLDEFFGRNLPDPNYAARRAQTRLTAFVVPRSPRGRGNIS